jgi:hypothetical protein
MGGKRTFRRRIEGGMSAFEISQLAHRMGMDGVVRFREGGDCLYLGEDDVLKLYQPQSVRRIGGRTSDRVLSGYIGFALRAEVTLDKGFQRRVPLPPSLSTCPMMNFPRLVRYSALVDGDVSADFSDEVHRHFRALPSTLTDVERCFGAGFFDLDRLERLHIMVPFLRALSHH